MDQKDQMQGVLDRTGVSEDVGSASGSSTQLINVPLQDHLCQMLNQRWAKFRQSDLPIMIR
jgi:hypothetical protein